MSKGPSAELLAAVNELAVENQWSPTDILTIMSYETSGTMDPWQKGPVTQWGEHRGLIQWGEPQRKQYGVTQDMPVREQVQAAGRYWRDRGAKPGMGILPLYAAVNGGRVDRINASDAHNGGAPGTVLDKVNNQMEGHRKNAYRWSGQDYVPQEQTGITFSNSGDFPQGEGVPPLEEDLPWQEQLGVDLKNVGKDTLSSGMKEGLMMAITGGGGSDMPQMPEAYIPPPPPVQRRGGRTGGPVVLRERETKRK